MDEACEQLYLKWTDVRSPAPTSTNTTPHTPIQTPQGVTAGAQPASAGPPRRKLRARARQRPGNPTTPLTHPHTVSVMTTTPTLGFTRPVRGVKVHSRQTLGGCAPTYGRIELDFEPPPAGAASSIEFARTATPEPAPPEFEDFLAKGVMRELAAADTADPDAHRGAPANARVIVRAMSWHYVDTCELVFLRLGALAVREALNCAAEDREPQLIETRVRLIF